VLGPVLVNKIGLVWHLGEFYWFMSQHTKFLSQSLKGKDLSLVSKVILCGNLRNVACWSVSWLFLSRLECNGGLSWITCGLRKNALISRLDEFSRMTRWTEFRLVNVDRYWLSPLCTLLLSPYMNVVNYFCSSQKYSLIYCRFINALKCHISFALGWHFAFSFAYGPVFAT
jgi:hypothetical protein